MALQSIVVAFCALAVATVLAQAEFGIDQAGIDQQQLGYPHHHHHHHGGFGAGGVAGGFISKKDPYGGKVTKGGFIGGGFKKFRSEGDEAELGYASPLDSPQGYHVNAMGRSAYAPASAPAPAYAAAHAPTYAPVSRGIALSYPSPAPTVPCGSNILVGCSPQVAHVPCSSSPSYSGGQSYGAPSYRSALY